jgi:putative sporulation protein YtaF
MIQILLVTALCLDAFAASLAYAINKTEIPFRSMTVISLICTTVLGISLGIGSAVKQIIPVNVTGIICFIILLCIGIIKCFECIFKHYILKNQKSEKQIKLKLFDINFVLMVYADNIKADIDNSKVLSSKEAVYLALALSLDGFAAGFGYGLTDINYFEIIILSLISNIIAVSLGYVLGKFLAKITDIDFSWLGGVILIILAFMKLK